MQKLCAQYSCGKTVPTDRPDDYCSDSCAALQEQYRQQLSRAAELAAICGDLLHFPAGIDDVDNALREFYGERRTSA